MSKIMKISKHPGRSKAATTRVSPRGQVTIPKLIREYLDVADGGPVEFAIDDRGAVVLRRRFDSARPLRGALSAYASERAPSVEEVDAGIGREVARLDTVSRTSATPAPDEVADDNSASLNDERGRNE